MEGTKARSSDGVEGEVEERSAGVLSLMICNCNLRSYSKFLHTCDEYHFMLEEWLTSQG